MQTYMLKHHAETTLSKLAAEHPSIHFEVVEIGGGFIIRAKRPANIEWSDEILSSLNQHGVDIVTDHTTAPEAQAPVETQAPTEAQVTAPAEADAVPAEKPKKEPKPKVSWSVMWKTAPDKVAARVSRGEPPFKPGSKRDITRLLLEQENGCTVEEAMAALGWDKATVLSSFTEIATLMPGPDGTPGRRKVVTTKGAEGQPNRYTMGPPMTTEQVEQERTERAARRANLAIEKEQKAKDREAKKVAAEAAAKAAAEVQQAAANQPAPEQTAAQ